MERVQGQQDIHTDWKQLSQTCRKRWKSIGNCTQDAYRQRCKLSDTVQDIGWQGINMMEMLGDKRISKTSYINISSTIHSPQWINRISNTY